MALLPQLDSLQSKNDVYKNIKKLSNTKSSIEHKEDALKVKDMWLKWDKYSKLI